MKPNYKNPSNRALAWLSTSLITLASAQAATIAFDAPFLIINDTALDVVPLTYPGATIAQAVNFGSGAGSGAQSVVTGGAQTVNFTAGTTSGAAASGTATTLFQVGTQGGVLLSPTTTGDTQFDNVLKSDGWASTGNNATPITLQIGGLTIGQTYVVSLFSADGRSTDRAQQYFDTFSAGTFSGGSSSAFSQNPSTMVTGTFTADAGFQRIYIQETDGVGGDDTTLSAFTLYAIPEPSSALLVAGAGLLIGFRRSRR